MGKQVFKIDENGCLQFGYDKVIEDTEETPTGYTNIPLPKDIEGKQLPFYRPRLNGTEWIEDMIQEEIDALNNQPRELTEIEQLKISQAEQFETILELLGGMM